MNDRPETIAFCWKRLPHWEVAKGRYFVTIHLAGAIPQVGQRRIRTLRADLDRAVANGQDGLRQYRAIFREMENWLDRADTVAHLRHPHLTAAISGAIRHREQNGTWTVFNYVIMPNHVHLFFRLGDSRSPVPQAAARGQGLGDLIQARSQGHLASRASLGTASSASDLRGFTNKFKPYSTQRFGWAGCGRGGSRLRGRISLLRGPRRGGGTDAVPAYVGQ